MDNTTTGKTALPADEIAALLQSDFGAPIDLQPLSEGLESQAFGFMAAGQALVVRVNRDVAGFAKDDFACRHFAAAALPIPEVLSITRHGDIVLCVSRRAEGRTLQDVDTRQLAGLVQPVSVLMDAIAAADVAMIEGCGPFAADGQGAFADWPAYVGAIADPRCYDWRQAERMAGKAIIRSLLTYLDRFAARCPNRRSLVHGDFGSNNVLAHEGRITGVIDWSEAMVGDPLYDVANILFWRPWLACMEAQARFFETQQPWRLADSDILLSYQLRIGLENIHEAALAEDRADFDWALARCRAIAVEAGRAINELRSG
ncbi:phosphotransferase family protein [Labrys neptuniae]